MRRILWVAVAVVAAGGISFGQGAKPDLKPWSEVGKDMQVEAGFWNILRDKKQRRFWVEVPSSHMKKPFLVATSISGGTTMRGWQWNDWLLVWEKRDRQLVLLEREVGYVIKKGTKISFVDDEKASILIETAQSNKIFLDDDAEMIQIVDQHGNSVTLDSNGMEIKSAKDLKFEASGNVEIKGQKVDVK